MTINSNDAGITVNYTGRINLINEYVDYNGGCVSPAIVCKNCL